MRRVPPYPDGMNATFKNLLALTSLLMCEVPSLAQADKGAAAGSPATAQRMKAGAATVTIITSTRVDFPPLETTKRSAQNNGNDASGPVNRKATPATASKPGQRELIVDFQ